MSVDDPRQTEVDIVQLDLVNYNQTQTISLLEYYSVMNITHSIFDNCMSGTIDIADTGSLREDLPIIGEETLKVKFRTGSKEVSAEFRVYKLADLEAVINATANAYKLYFVSTELIENEKKIIKKVYSNKTVDSIVKDLFGNLNSSKPIELEPTLGLQKLVVRSKKPLQAINMLTNYSISKNSQGSLFSFYETPSGFFFKNVEELYVGDTKQTFKVNFFVAEDDLQNEFKVVEDFNVIRGFDHLKDISDGMYNNRVFSLDLLTRTYKVKEYNYQKNFSDTKHIEEGFPFYSPGSDNPTSFQEKFIATRSSRQSSSFIKQNNGDITFKKGIEEVLPYRISMLRQLQNQMVQVTVYGNSTIEAGDIIELDIPVNSYEGKTQTEAFDPDYSGRWLVVSVTHSFNVDEHTSIYTCSKDVFKQVPTVSIK